MNHLLTHRHTHSLERLFECWTTLLNDKDKIKDIGQLYILLVAGRDRIRAGGSSGSLSQTDNNHLAIYT